MAARKKLILALLIGLGSICLVTLALSWNLPSIESTEIMNNLNEGGKGIRGVKNEEQSLNIKNETIENKVEKEATLILVEINDDGPEDDEMEIKEMEELAKVDFVTETKGGSSKQWLETEYFHLFPSMDSDAKCQFENRGYDRSQFFNLFPRKDYAKCSDVLRFNPITVKNDSIHINCLYKEGQYYVSSPRSSNLSFPLENPLNFTSFTSPIEIKAKTRDFIFIKCSYTIRSVYLTLKPSLRSSYKSKSKTLSLMQENSIPSITPLGVHLILFESLSRGSFYHSLESTINFLNSEIINSADFVAYDFFNTHSQDSDKISNLLPLLLGANVSTHSSRIRSVNKSMTVQDFEDIQRAYSIWSHFENFGFVTYLGFDSVWGLLKDHIGNTVTTDHSLLEFWHVARQVFGYSDYSPKQRCLGGKNAHRHLLDHMLDFVKAYKGHNKFSISHTGMPAEASGKVVYSLDDDLKEVINDLIEVYKENKENFVLLLIGDSGRDKYEWERSDEGIFENKNPAFFIIASQNVVKDLGKNSHELLKYNSKRLVSKFDIFLSLLHLSVLPFYGDKVMELGIYEDLKKSVQMENAVSLMAEKIPNERKCEDVFIDEDFCFCRDYEDLDIQRNLVQYTLLQITDAYLNFMNKNNFNGKTCKKLTLDKVQKASRLILKPESQGGNQHLRFQFSVKENPKAIIEFTYYALQTKEYYRFKPKFHRIVINVTSAEPDTMNNYMIQLENTRRLDDNSCIVSENKQATNQICVCE